MYRKKENKTYFTPAVSEIGELRRSEPIANLVSWLAVLPLFILIACLNHMSFTLLLQVTLGTSIVFLFIYAQLVCFGRIIMINSSTRDKLTRVKKVQTFPFWLISISITVVFALTGIFWH